MHDYLACFDISDDRVRYRVVKALGSHGNRVQKSVFEISVKTEPQFRTLRQELDELLESGDKLYFYRLCHPCRHKSVDSQGQPLPHPPAVIIV